MGEIIFHIVSGTPLFDVALYRTVDNTLYGLWIYDSIGIYTLSCIPSGVYYMIVTDDHDCVVRINSITVLE